ncbi:BBM_1a_G0017880.mRNA.1.CDS.1 [Saccharomyces cerevisiae]|nr:Brr6p [Saccharomyces cerevisiae YJM1399]CAI4455094.1 ADE_G0017630.mRNA.1.CDS.1 [Saccharomyces cerevisiae]CAI4456352.1 BBM_1a_G0017880.mRNA.1.CDS.1 [Saccharomyces cerevisiae]CAI5259391.1 ALI_HP2_G0013170.mRNA.1.CDS.1 [Saccharomyces cerevisiae]CAI6458737.1 ALI_HP2_G0013170.mRNA.1.CDS.1 [Saccharomyces cerevisiae]
MELRSFSRQPDGILANPRLGREEVLEGEHPQDARLARQSIWLSPSLIAEYIQLFFNFIIGTIGLSLAIKFILMIRNDVNLKLEHNVREELDKIATCKSRYFENQCEPHMRVPALEVRCNEWSKCMNKEIVSGSDYQWAKAWARTLAEVINAFFEAFSIRSFLFILISIIGIVFVTNTSFGSYRVYLNNKDTKSVRHA